MDLGYFWVVFNLTWVWRRPWSHDRLVSPTCWWKNWECHLESIKMICSRLCFEWCNYWLELIKVALQLLSPSGFLCSTLQARFLSGNVQKCWRILLNWIVRSSNPNEFAQLSNPYSCNSRFRILLTPWDFNGIELEAMSSVLGTSVLLQLIGSSSRDFSIT